MNIQQVETKNGITSFIIKGAKFSAVNALRRASMDLIPTLAIESVEFRKNSGVLYDEMVAHRMGLIPLKTDYKAYDVKAKCACKGEGCARCEVIFTLKTSAPGNITANMMKSKDPSIKPIFDMPIVKLIKGQEIELEAKASMGLGKDHAKYSPGKCWYKAKPKITINQDCNKDEVKDICPVNVFDIKGGKLTVVKEHDCHLCNACVDISKGKVNVEDTEEYIFYVEPWGQLSVKEMMTTACSALDEVLQSFEESLAKAKEEK